MTESSHRPVASVGAAALLLPLCAVLSGVGLAALGWFVAARVAPDAVPTPGGGMRAAMMVLVSAAIGFLTNRLAIRMMFRPRKRLAWLVFWPQGLLPREQERFARAIGEVAAKHLMNPEALGAALRVEGVVPAWGKRLRVEIEDLLASAAVRRALTQSLTDALRDHGPALVQRLRPELRAALARALDEAIGPERVLAWLENALRGFAHDRARRRAVAHWIARETAREGAMARLMELLQDQFFAYRQRHPIRGFLAEQFVIDWDALRDGITETLKSPSATEDLAEALVETAETMAERLRQPEAAESVARVRDALIERALDWMETEGLGRVSERLSQASSSPEAWDAIEQAVAGFLDRLPARFADDGEGLSPMVIKRLASLQEDLLRTLPVAHIVEQQVLAMDPGDVERVVEDVGRRELAWIQVVGFVAGAVMGGVLAAVV